MLSQYYTDDQLDALDPEQICVAVGSGDGDTYVFTGREILDEICPADSLSKALTEYLADVRCDDFEIIAVNEMGRLVNVLCDSPN